MPKLDKLRLFRNSHHLDCVCIVETWLDYGNVESEVEIEGYNVLRLDFNRQGGSVIVYVNSCFMSLYKGPIYEVEFISAS